MKRFLISFAAAFALFSCTAPDKPYSLRMVDSEIARNPEASYLDGRGGRLKWNYTTGLELLSFLDASRRYEDDSYVEYVKQWADSITDANGNIRTYKRCNYNLDHICPARIFFRLYDIYGDRRYRNVLDSIRLQLETQPRTEAGPFWHKQIYPGQVWLDGLYMAMPFYAEYTMRFTPEEQRDAVWEDIAREFSVASQKTFDPETGLFRHAWDETRSMFWADPQTGQSAHAWGRAEGWYALALAETIQYMPKEHPATKELLREFNVLMNAVRKYADPESRMWYQVLDCPGREGNYLEATCSSMFVYAALKGVRKGWLPKETWGNYSRRLYRRLVSTFIRENPDRTISLTGCCAVAGLGGKQNRAGDYAYYLSEPVVDNDPKGVGPFIWASLEYELLK